ncbi:hypothetical protein FB566_5120 [Stackebrandtia endophytica]|uniref:Uncharacterized protein n=1 Tax=Stackebrandtia endophytica TaxID=1496996 RepID=A0A543B3U6_9ACTN|nr:hypothetical protein [Stackebrandtia endophytica]TQL79511.1 hypothetical protein FB566_5120 [Stackebrandtia endophytica]
MVYVDRLVPPDTLWAFSFRIPHPEPLAKSAIALTELESTQASVST